MIKSFASKNTEDVFEGQYVRRCSNKLEKLVGKRDGQYSIRINRRWRICFEWEGRNAYRVEIVDYHK